MICLRRRERTEEGNGGCQEEWKGGREEERNKDSKERRGTIKINEGVERGLE